MLFSEIKGVKEGSERILKAVASKERIILFGDSDPDGVSSVVILEEALNALGVKPFFVYFPDWRKEDYGFNKKALHFLKDKAPALLIIADCGIGNFEETKSATEMGFDILMIEHHEPLEREPVASVIVNPKQEKDSPFLNLCTAGIVYNFVKLILSEAQIGVGLENFLELAAIATISDQMPKDEKNMKIIEEGIISMRNTKRQGLLSLFKACGIEKISERKIRERVVPLLSCADCKNHKSEAYLLLTGDSVSRSQEIANLLLQKSIRRKEAIIKALEEAEAMIDPFSPLVFLGKKEWLLSLTGVLASRIYSKYKKPTFVFKKGKEKSRGSVRTPKSINSVEMMKNCSHLLKTYGGHAQASGFALENEKLEDFKKCLSEFLKSN